MQIQQGGMVVQGTSHAQHGTGKDDAYHPTRRPSHRTRITTVEAKIEQ